MNRSLRHSIAALIVGTIACGALAVVAHSQVLAVVAACFAAIAVVAMFAASTQSVQPAFAVAAGDVEPSVGLDARREAFSALPPSDSGVDNDAVASDDPPVVEEVAQHHVSPVRLPAALRTPEVLSALLESAGAAGNVLSAHLWLDDPATSTLRFVESVGDVSPAQTPIPSTSGLAKLALDTPAGALATIEGGHEWDPTRPEWRYALALDDTDVRGMAFVDFSGPEQPNREDIESAMATLRGSLAGALVVHVARLEARAAKMLTRACAQLATILDPDDVLATALDRAMQLSSAQTGSIMLLDEPTHRMHIAAARGLPDDIVINTDVAEGDGIAGWVLASQQPVVIEDLKDAGVRSRRHGIRSAVCVPLADEESVLGVLCVGSAVFHARLSARHLESLQALARVVVASLRRAWTSHESKDLYFDTLRSLSVALETRDPYARGGTDRVVELCEAMSAYYGLSADDAAALRIAAMLRDVGMSATGTVVGAADRPLSTSEWAMLKLHPIIASEILAESASLRDVLPLVYHHHEHFDGSGYVAGLAGSDIPLGARILAVADAYVAMTSRRPYRRGLSHAEAVVELERRSGSQFDPRAVRALLHVVEQSGEAAADASTFEPEDTTAAPVGRPSE
ncbi:MAG: GAF domain-containing protein [Coriobacteriia bacterium]|nr:GAF domain-containing protein [Coriobacteriia bacterium]